MIQNSLDRIYEGMIDTLRDSVAPTVGDPYVKAQVLAISELLGNLATRTEWRSADLAETIRRTRTVLAEADRAAPGDPSELSSARRLLSEPEPDPTDNTGLVAARAGHLAALGDVQAWLGATPGHVDLRASVDALIVDLLDEEMARVRTGMYRKEQG